MPRYQTREVPRWKRGTPSTSQPGGRDAKNLKNLTRELALARQQGTGKEGKNTAPAATLPAGAGAWRFRRHLPPFIWLAALLAAAGLRDAPHPVLCGLAAAIIVPALMTAAAWQRRRDGTFSLPAWTRRWYAAAAALTSLWLPFLAAAGLRPFIAWLLLTWAPFAGLWARRYRWRPGKPAERPSSPAADLAIWDRLAAKRRWSGRLQGQRDIPGGRKWDIRLDGTETHIGQILAEPRAVAAAWDKPQTEAYAEPDPSGIESRGILTILKGGTLERAAEWDGLGFSQDGTARVGRFADGMPARIRVWIPRDGTRHTLIAGCMGSGKSALLDLLVWLALKSPVPVIPVILDPQNGQSLPQWQGRVLYAAGVEECARLARGLTAGLMDRSLRLASMTWENDGHKVKGMPFFDHRLSGLPVVMPITDEAPLLLSGDGNPKLAAEMIRLQGVRAKLGRKAGDAECLVAQVPSLGELGDQALRSMFVGGNVICLRTGDKVSAGMIGLQTDPYALPKYFPSGEPTQGLGYVVSIDNRQAPMRSDLVPSRLQHEPAEVPQLEPEFLAAMDKAMGGVSPTSAFPDPLVVRAIHEAGLADAANASPDGRAVLRGESPEPDAPDGRRCVDAVWLVLAERGTDMDRGQVIQQVNELATGEPGKGGWGRARPFTIRAVTSALADLAEGKVPGRVVVKPAGGKGGVYRAVTTPSQEGI